jgi:CHASE3 domain sensor protein
MDRRTSRLVAIGGLVVMLVVIAIVFLLRGH